MFNLIPRWAWAALIIGVCGTGWMSSARWQHKYDALVKKQQADVLQAQAAASQATQANAEATAQLDENYFKEFKDAEKNANYWRNRAVTERVPNQTDCANNTSHRTSGGMGNDTAARSIDNRPLDVSGTAIIELSTVAAQMRAQVEYLQAKHLADARTVNGE